MTKSTNGSWCILILERSPKRTWCPRGHGVAVLASSRGRRPTRDEVDAAVVCQEAKQSGDELEAALGGRRRGGPGRRSRRIAGVRGAATVAGGREARSRRARLWWRWRSCGRTRRRRPPAGRVLEELLSSSARATGPWRGGGAQAQATEVVVAMDDGEEGDGRRGRRAAGVGRPGGVAEAGRRMQATRRRPRGRDEGVALVARGRKKGEVDRAQGARCERVRASGGAGGWRERSG